jgi:peptidyl-prolyl cis-trans isomerase SurA
MENHLVVHRTSVAADATVLPRLTGPRAAPSIPPQLMKLLRVIPLTCLALCGSSLASRADLVNGIKAVVDDAAITYGEVEADTMMLASELQRQYGRQPALFAQKVNEARNESMERAVQQQLILHDFKASGYNLPESVIDEVVQEEIKSRFGDRATLTKTLQAQGVTYEKWRQQARERFIVRQLQAKNIYQDSIISPHKIETYYLKHQTDFKVEEQVKLRMIVLTNGFDVNPETVRLRAEDILVKLKEGAAFSEMAGTYSESTQRSEGGEWGWVERSVLRKELANVAFTLKPGELSGVIDTPQADYIMLVEDRRAAHSKPLVEVQDEIEKTLITQERERLQRQYIEKLRKKTFVRYF